MTGSMTYTDVGGEALGGFTVDLVRTRTTDGGLILIGGPVIDSTKGYVESAPEGSNIAIVLQRGSPVNAFIHAGAPRPARGQLSGVPREHPRSGGPRP